MKGAIVLLIALAVAAFGQNTDPVIQGSFSYSMPQSAIDAGIDGNVTVAARVDERGTVVRSVLVAGPMWPCGSAKPVAALDELNTTLMDTIRKVQFTPSMKGGVPVSKDVSLKLTLKNPKLSPAAAIDAVTGKRIPRQISGGVLNGKATSLPKPAYPLMARENRDSGLVTVQILIDEEGNVVRAGAVQGASTLHEVARDAACRAEFSPTQLSGTPVKVSGVLTYNFVP